MTKNDELKFRELFVIFLNGMVQYPKDTERMESGFKLFTKFIDSLVERECSAIVSQTAQLRSIEGKIKN